MIVIYGRRRCGKSRLLQQILDTRRDVYYLSDMRDGTVQREALAHEIARVADGTTMEIDEFTYLVRVSPELPSVLQRIFDTYSDKPYQFVLCGSSQWIMHGLVLDQSAPLYGRAREIVKINPLSARWVREALGVSGTKAVEMYFIWGGVPRNWDLVADCENIQEAIRSLVLDRNGILHNEPPRLLLDDMRSAVRRVLTTSLITADYSGGNISIPV